MKRLFIVIPLCIVSQIVMAQWTYILTINGNGALTVNKYGPYSTKEECERNRLYDITANTWSNSIGGSGWRGTINVKATATPCTGPGGGAIGNIDILGVGKGSSFYSTNFANEIQNWSSDDMERMLALNPEHSPKEPKTVATGDISFDNIIESMPYSDEGFSGRMPRGSSHIVTDGNITAIGKPAKGTGVLVPDDFFDKPFDYGLGVWSSDDLVPLNIDLKPVRPLPYPKEEAGISDFWFDLAGDVAKTAKDVYDISKVLAGTATTVTSAAAIRTTEVFAS